MTAIDIKGAMVLAAGLGSRMRPLTNKRPKPLVKVRGKPLIDYALDRLARAGVETAVVNLHYKADMLEAHLKARTSPAIVLSDERKQLLDTGGGTLQALPHFADAPFFYLNTDSILIDGRFEPLSRLQRLWRDDAMDALLLMSTFTRADGYSGRGDFNMDAFGRLARRGEREIATFVWTGTMIIHPRLFDGCPPGPFSTNVVLNKALAAGRAYGVRHDGRWLHVGSPDAILMAEKRLDDEAGGQATP